MQIINRALQIIILSVKKLMDPYYQGFPEAISFGFMMSIIPLVILLSYALAVFKVPINVVFDIANEYLNSDAAKYLMNLLTNTVGNGGVTIALVIAILYGASKAHYSMACIANHMSHLTNGGSYIAERLRAILNTLITIVTVAIALILLVYGELIFNIVVHVIFSNAFVDGIGAAEVAGRIEEIMTSTVAKLLLWIRWPIMLCIFSLVLSLNFYVLPAKRARFRYSIPGGAFAGLGIIVVSKLFSFYTSSLATYNLIYGSAAALVALMFWFYLISWVMVLGLVLNEVLQELRGDRRDALSAVVRDE